MVWVEVLNWLHHPDGMVQPDLDLRRDIARVIRTVRPDVVVSQSPEANWDRIYGTHPDHLATARATMAAVYPDSRNPRAFPQLLDEGLEPHKVSEVWITHYEPNRYIDITDTFELKLAALRAHGSQTSRIDDLEGLLRDWGGRQAADAGLAAGRLAEGFRVVDTR